jgi:hypothetical protein
MIPIVLKIMCDLLVKSPTLHAQLPRPLLGLMDMEVDSHKLSWMRLKSMLNSSRMQWLAWPSCGAVMFQHCQGSIPFPVNSC